MNKRIIQSILDNAPEGATHVSSNGVYYSNSNKQNFECMVWWRRGEEWIESSIDHITQSLADLQTQLDQLNEIERLNVALSNMVRTSEGGIGHFYSIDEFYENREYADRLLKELNK